MSWGFTGLQTMHDSHERHHLLVVTKEQGIMIKSKVKGETLRFGSQLSKRKVLGIPHFHCT